MNTENKIFKLIGKVQHYDWGGFEFIPNWLGIENIHHLPFAEYWMGAHASAPSHIIYDDKTYNLHELIDKNPKHFLSEKISNQFQTLPYLFKILDVRNMLSIQVHPSKTEAEKGFEQEEKFGIHISASHRNYKDKNHKPEMMVALSDFYLLHGFKNKEELKKILNDVKEFESLKEIFGDKNYKALYQYIMLLSQNDVDKILFPLIKREIEKKGNNQLSKIEPGWWVAKFFENKKVDTNFDRGIFSIYFFNLVKLKKDEGIFQDAGVPHAYLEGQNMELMASSDNVLRGGLTNKHVDINELMKHIIFEGIAPAIIYPEQKDNTEKAFNVNVADFGMSKIELKEYEFYQNKSRSLEIFCLIDGALQINGSNVLQASKGEAFTILPNEKYTFTTNNFATVYKAFVP